ncbi:MAG: TonB-dependent receptor plug domain-containing protein, partial [Prosthecobacter sp.]
MSAHSSRPLLIARLTTALFACSIATAQQPASKPKTQPVELDEVVIAAPKLSKGLLESAFSATVADGKEIEARGAQTLKDASFTAPNTFFGEFAARKLSNPRFRGIGGYPSQGATVYYDNVPQFHANSSSLTLVDVDQVDFVRGPQAALFGRNTPGGLMSVTSRRPSMGAWSGTLETTHGNYNLRDYRGSITGALVPETLGFSLAGGYNGRDGYTENTVTGNDVDWRRAWFGKMQFLWTPSKELEVRFILAGESARDGDYGLNDLAQLRANPRRTQRNFEGFTNRDVLLPTLQITYHADAFDFTSTTGFVWWETTD